MGNLLEQLLDQSTLSVYDGRYLGSQEGLTDSFLDVKFKCLLLRVWLVSFYGIKIGPNGGIGIGK